MCPWIVRSQQRGVRSKSRVVRAGADRPQRGQADVGADHRVSGRSGESGFSRGFYRTLEDARTSVRFQGDHHRAEILGASGERLVGRSGCLSGFPQRRE